LVTVSIFLHPEVKAYDQGYEGEALHGSPRKACQMGDEIHYKEWRIDMMHGESGWEALIYPPSSPLHEICVPH
jgi:hypothetical protein